MKVGGNSEKLKLIPISLPCKLEPNYERTECLREFQSKQVSQKKKVCYDANTEYNVVHSPEAIPLVLEGKSSACKTGTSGPTPRLNMTQ